VVVCLAVLALAAATSSPALADSGVPDMSIPTVPDVAEATAAVLDEAGLSELDPTAVVDPSNALPAVPAQMTAAEPVTGGAVAAPPPEPAAEAPIQAEPVAEPTPDAPPPADIAQTAPTNINVSVRVNSPGDNGSVEQANTAAAAGEAPATETAAQYRPDVPQYQAPIPDSATPTAEPAPQTPSAEPAQTTDGWTWNWEWNCGDAMPDIAVPPEVGTQNWTWNWDWDCGAPDPIPENTAEEKPPQYRPGVTQYRPININISIRINSPGNDGPVSQTNIAVLLAAPALPKLRIEVPAPLPTQAGSDLVTSEATDPLTFMAEIVNEVFADPAEPAAEDAGCCAAAEPRGVETAGSEPQSLLLPEAPPPVRRDLSAKERFRASVAVTIRLAKASEAAARIARPAPKPAQLRPLPRHTAAPAREEADALSAAGFAPMSAADGRLGYFILPVVWFAFAIAFAHASRSVAAEVRAAGEDPDPPPDRPG
jgi:hypothetical protein